MMNNCIVFKNICYYLSFFILIQLLFSHHLFSETNPYFDSKKGKFIIHNKYNIHQITVRNIFIKGKTILDGNYIYDITGIHPGDITLNTKVDNSIRELWKSNLFKNVTVFKKEVGKNKIDLLYKLEDLDEIHDIKIKEKGGNEVNPNQFLSITNIQFGYRIPQYLIRVIKEDIQSFYEKKGYPNVSVKYKILEDKNTSKNILYFLVIKGKIVEIEEIDFDGNKIVSDQDLLTCMINTKSHYPFPFIQKPVYYFVQENIKQDLIGIQKQYQSIGNRYANIFLDSVWEKKTGNYGLKIKIIEGKRYYIRNISIHGNEHVDTDTLKRILFPKMMKRGKYYKNVYNRIRLEKRLFGKDCRSVFTQYLNLGYLFVKIFLEEKLTRTNQVDLFIRIYEQEPVHIHEIKIKGNVITNEEIIRREFQMMPGDKISPEKIKESFVSLEKLNLFNQISFRFVPYKNNSVDIEWNVVEKNANEIQLQGSLGGNCISKFIGRLNFNFKNFSIKNIFHPRSWDPVPQGDGQKLQISSEFGRYFHSYGFSFTDPWIKKKMPISVTIEANHLRKEITNNEDADSLNESAIEPLNEFSSERLFLDQTLGSLIVSKTLPFIDPYSNVSFSINGEKNSYYKKKIDSSYYNKRFQFNDINTRISLERDSTILNPIFPFSGSYIKLEGVFSPMYNDFYEKNKKISIVHDQKKWKNYFKVKFLTYWYKKIMDRLILKLIGETGYIGNYQGKKPELPFHKFYMGGVQPKGIGNNYISFRGYDFPKKDSIYEMASDGGSFYKKIGLELRYLLHNAPTLKMWTLFFIEGGNVDDSYRIFSKKMNKSFGIGFRSYWPPIGFIGVDFGCPINSFMKKEDNYFNPKWKSHIIMGDDV
ncbi:BamA/OMP85 family outer membrane protein [Blattabacterium cuenoti]|uniref:BamA/OMP85 family outer membrane protein n=1 Tax=Blattabacterium cuenoti TaxID=1653831 RepID=UPI00163C1F16|nr:POTRA domain-containing protein [Blattabacterium cuenoti]